MVAKNTIYNKMTMVLYIQFIIWVCLHDGCICDGFKCFILLFNFLFYIFADEEEVERKREQKKKDIETCFGFEEL